MNKNLFFSVLSMDAYNRGSTVGLVIASEALGSAVVNSSSGPIGGGFSATAYKLLRDEDGLTAGSNIISYRGTDDGFDPFLGWPGNFGVAYTPQALLAGDFYNFIANNNSGPIALTGHSLGGGLAGIVAAVHGKEAVLVANMAFELAAQNIFGEASINESSDQQLLREIFYNGQEPALPDTSHIKTVAIDGEIAEPLRWLQTTPQITWAYPTNTFNPLERHSAALHVMMAYADENNISITQWRDAAAPMLEALTSDEVATVIGYNQLQGTAAPYEKMNMAIAYSALESVNGGGIPFGDTALAAFFSDAKDLSAAISQPNPTPSFTAALESISKIAVEHSGQLALNKVQAANTPLAAEGALYLSEAANQIVVGFTDPTWTFNGALKTSNFKFDLIRQAEIDVGGRPALWDSDLCNALDWFAEKTSQTPDSSYDMIKSVTFQVGAGSASDPTTMQLTTNDLSMLFLAPYYQQVQLRPGLSNLVVGSESRDIVTGAAGHDILIGNQGYDDLFGGDGADYLMGNEGSDCLDGGSGANKLFGGADADKIISNGDGDVINGGSGNDILCLASASSTIEFDSGYGSDLVEFLYGDGDYALNLWNLNPDDIEIYAGGRNVYGLSWEGISDGLQAQFIGVRVKSTGDQITFLENGRDGIGPDGSGGASAYNKGYLQTYYTYPEHEKVVYSYSDYPNEGKLDRIVFADGTVWSQETIWSHVTKADDWSYDTDYKTTDWSDSEFLQHVTETYLQADADYAAGRSGGGSNFAAQFGASQQLAFQPEDVDMEALAAVNDNYVQPAWRWGLAESWVALA